MAATRAFLGALLLCATASAGRAPDQAPVIDRKDWCTNGAATATTGECMCDYSCTGSKCESGMSKRITLHSILQTSSHALSLDVTLSGAPLWRRHGHELLPLHL